MQYGTWGRRGCQESGAKMVRGQHIIVSPKDGECPGIFYVSGRWVLQSLVRKRPRPAPPPLPLPVYSTYLETTIEWINMTRVALLVPCLPALPCPALPFNLSVSRAAQAPYKFVSSNLSMLACTTPSPAACPPSPFTCGGPGFGVSA